MLGKSIDVIGREDFHPLRKDSLISPVLVEADTSPPRGLGAPQIARETGSWRTGVCEAVERPADHRGMEGVPVPQPPTDLAQRKPAGTQLGDRLGIHRVLPGPAQTHTLRLRPPDAGEDPLADQFPLKLGDRPQHREEQPAGGRRRVDGLLRRDEIASSNWCVDSPRHRNCNTPQHSGLHPSARGG